MKRETPQPPPFALRSDGDDYEIRYWEAFAEKLFPAYEQFWLPNIVPLTYRIVDRRNVRFRSDEELERDGYGHEDLAVAQLHYTLLLHLGRVWERLEATASFDARELGHGIGFNRHDFFEHASQWG